MTGRTVRPTTAQAVVRFLAAPHGDGELVVVPGPERAWRICDDPAHAWVRDIWAGQGVDPRLNGGQ